MPSDKKRINLTVPDHIYEQIQVYKAENGISNDASACLQLIVQQLRSHENSKMILSLLKDCSLETILQLSQSGYTMLKESISDDTVMPSSDAD